MVENHQRGVRDGQPVKHRTWWHTRQNLDNFSSHSFKVATRTYREVRAYECRGANSQRSAQSHVCVSNSPDIMSSGSVKTAPTCDGPNHILYILCSLITVRLGNPYSVHDLSLSNKQCPWSFKIPESSSVNLSTISSTQPNGTRLIRKTTIYEPYSISTWFIPSCLSPCWDCPVKFVVCVMTNVISGCPCGEDSCTH